MAHGAGRIRGIVPGRRRSKASLSESNLGANGLVFLSLMELCRASLAAKQTNDHE